MNSCVGYYETILHGGKVNTCVGYYVTILHGGKVNSCAGYYETILHGGQSIAVQVTMRLYYMGGRQ